MKTYALFVFTFLSASLTFANAEDVFVTIETGTVRGMTNVSQNGTVYTRFLGIPYAAPPVGDLRFRAPQPPANWTGVLDALYERDSCPTEGGSSEDCLYLNVFAPHNASGNAVLVWIYGGAFRGGSDSVANLGPDFFMEHGVIKVDLNYRNGAIGLLSLQNEDIPGNAGLKDMVFALQWVQRNIAAFGGDPEKVTLGGHSSGASSVAHLYISPATKGLYRSAIIMSGQATACWSIEPNPRERAYRLGEALGYTGNNDTELAQLLRSVNHTELTVDDDRVLTDFEEHRISALAWAPVIEPELEGAVIWESPARILSEGRFNQVPVLTGITSADGSINVRSTGVLDDPVTEEEFRENFTSLVGSQLLLPDVKDQIRAAQKIEVFYFGELGLTSLLPQAFYDLCSDMMWIAPTASFVSMVATLNPEPVYYYYFDYNGTGSTEFGVPHGAELKYIYIRNGVMPNQDPDSIDGKVKDVMITAWSNFVKYGDPAPGGKPVLWQPYTPDAHNYLEFTPSGDILQRQDALKVRMDFWAEIMPLEVHVQSAASANVMERTTLLLVVILCAATPRLLF